MNINLLDMVLAFSKALDLFHPKISDHHLRVGYIGACIAETLELPFDDIHDVFMAGALHDVGAASSATRLALLDFAMGNYDIDDVPAVEDLHRHGYDAYRLMRNFPPLAAAAPMIRFHHVEWAEGRGAYFDGCAVPLGAHLLNIADRIAVLPDPERNILAQSDDIRARIAAASARFRPDMIEAFLDVSARESFWLDLMSPQKTPIIQSRFKQREVELDLDGLYDLARIFGHIIDYRCPFTATHSTGVAAVAEALAAHAGMDADQCRQIGIAGLLHDLGKLAVPVEILNKPARLTTEEMLIVRQHSYHTHRILATVPDFETINQWASWHHERLDGGGYPFRPTDLPLGSRLIAVADVFTALTEDRPYRDGMHCFEAIDVLDNMVKQGAIDGDVVRLLRANAEFMGGIRQRSQQDRRMAMHEVSDAPLDRSGIMSPSPA